MQECVCEKTECTRVRESVWERETARACVSVLHVECEGPVCVYTCVCARVVWELCVCMYVCMCCVVCRCAACAGRGFCVCVLVCGGVLPVWCEGFVCV